MPFWRFGYRLNRQQSSLHWTQMPPDVSWLLWAEGDGKGCGGGAGLNSLPFSTGGAANSVPLAGQGFLGLGPGFPMGRAEIWPRPGQFPTSPGLHGKVCTCCLEVAGDCPIPGSPSQLWAAHAEFPVKPRGWPGTVLVKSRPH